MFNFVKTLFPSSIWILVFSYSQPVVDKKQWILNPDLVVALGLIKEGNSWASIGVKKNKIGTFGKNCSSKL